MSANVQQYQAVQGTAEAVDATPNAEVLAAVAGKVIRLQKAVVQVTVAAVGGAGEVALEDGEGGTQIFVADADAVRVVSIDFGDRGYPLTSGTALNLTVEDAVTTQATASCSAVGIAV